MTTITIIGTGTMANAIASVLSAGSSDVTQISRGQIGTAPLSGDIVVLAVPYGAVADILAAYGEAFAGKTVVDITNPVDFETFDSLVVPADGSATAVIQAALPHSSVLKAFNTTFAATLASRQVGDSDRTTVLIAGDDAVAKQALVDAIEAGGVGAIDAGSLKRARELEAMGFLQIALAAGEKVSWSAGFAVVG